MVGSDDGCGGGGCWCWGADGCGGAGLLTVVSGGAMAVVGSGGGAGWLWWEVMMAVVAVVAGARCADGCGGDGWVVDC